MGNTGVHGGCIRTCHEVIHDNVTGNCVRIEQPSRKDAVNRNDFRHSTFLQLQKVRFCNFPCLCQPSLSIDKMCRSDFKNLPRVSGESDKL